MEFNNIRAALLVMIAMAAITTNDAIVKHISQVFGIGQIMFIRGLLTCAVFAIVLSYRGQPVFNRRALHRWNLIRGLLELLATLFFLTGLSLLLVFTTLQAEEHRPALEDRGAVALNRLAIHQQLESNLTALAQDDPVMMGSGRKSVGRAVLMSAAT